VHVQQRNIDVLVREHHITVLGFVVLAGGFDGIEKR
jgi:hypothetical protein